MSERELIVAFKAVVKTINIKGADGFGTVTFMAEAKDLKALVEKGDKAIEVEVYE